jgi:hypothetical protein
VTVFTPVPPEAKLAPLAYFPVAVSKPPLPAVMVPKSKLMVAAAVPMGALVLACPADASFCACASLLTSKL